ncbi:MAG: hypothetical protein ACLQNE_33960 [Thermoguttaceae bacterium]
MRLLDEEVEEAAVGIPRWLVPGIGLLGLLVLLVLGLARDEWVLGAAGFGVFLILAVLLLIVQRAAPPGAQGRRHQRSRERERVAQQIAGIASALEKLRAEQSVLRQRIQQQSELAGIDFPADSPGGTHAGAGRVDQEEELVERQLLVLQQRRPVQQRLDEHRTAFERARTALGEAGRKHAEVQDQLNQAEGG